MITFKSVAVLPTVSALAALVPSLQIPSNYSHMQLE